MPRSNPLLDAVIAAPEEDAPRLAYADSLGEDPYAEFIRVQVERSRGSEDGRREARLARKEAELWGAHQSRWSAPFKKTGAYLQFRRGFVEQINLASFEFIRHASWLLSRVPARDLVLNHVGHKEARSLFAMQELARFETLWIPGGESSSVWRELWASPHLRQLRRLGSGIPPEYVRELARGRLPRLSALSAGQYSARQLAALLSAGLTELQALEVEHTQLGVAGAAGIADSPGFATLKSLDLHASRLGDAGMARLARRPSQLRRLWVSDTGIGSRGVAALTNAPWATTLEELAIGFNALDDSALRPLANLPALRILRLGGLPITAIGLEHLLAHLGPRLEVLDLGRCPLSAAAIAVLTRAPLPRLRSLRLDQASLEVRDVVALAGSPSLRHLQDLELENLSAGDAGAEALAAGPFLELRRLKLDFARIGEAGGRALARWPRSGVLHTLDLNGNYIIDTKIQQALLRRFGRGVTQVGGVILGYQHPVPSPEEMKPQPDEPPPRQRRKPKEPPLRRDWTRGIKELLHRGHFATWDGYVDAECVARAEEVLHAVADELLVLGERAPVAKQRAALKRGITRLNALDARHNFLHTIEREDVADEFALIQRYTACAEDDELLDRWRDF